MELRGLNPTEKHQKKKKNQSHHFEAMPANHNILSPCL